MRYILTAGCIGMMLAMAGCGASVPDKYDNAPDSVRITPDYTGLTVPANIAPLNFEITSPGDEFVTRIRGNRGGEIVVGGREVRMPVDRWHSLLADADSVLVDVFVRRGDNWAKHPTIANAVSDSIDPYISYRLIEPSYITFEDIVICQRNLENFDEREIYNSQMLSDSEHGQCINCHSFQNYNRDGNMQMHVRVTKPGTVIVRDGKAVKVNLKTDSTLSAGVYPSWHPQLPLIAYSVNTTTQIFHSRDRNKVEVQDEASDLILYDTEANTVSVISDEPDCLETFPYWSPDGRTLWYVSARIPVMDADALKVFKSFNYEDFKYDILKREFDPATRRFGPADTVLNASALGKSATLPRPSPDGRYMMFTMGRYGTFHIWHRDADLYMIDLANDSIRPLTEVNSDNVESYHSWSSNSRWIIFSTRRDDGSYTRLYLSHIGPDGRFSKPFILPQESPAHNVERFKSYNIPEFMVRPVTVTPGQLRDAVDREPVKAVYKQ